MINYTKNEKECERIKTENNILLKEFTSWLQTTNLKNKTVDQHVTNVTFYINEFLLYEYPENAKEGTKKISFFLGYWFIRKTMWASEDAIKNNAVSLKKFYTFLYTRGDIQQEHLDSFKQTIKERLPNWVDSLTRYNAPTTIDIEEGLGI